MLLLRPDPLPAETLESFLIRLAELYGYTPKQLIERFHIILDEKDQKLSGALPGNLSQLNIYHANTSSAIRQKCLELLAEHMCKHRLPIIELAVSRSKFRYGAGHRSLLWQGLDIPRYFMRRGCIPVCPRCIEEAAGMPYVPFYWHLRLVRACYRHGCMLVEQCPTCSKQFDYVSLGNFRECSCGRSFASMPTDMAPESFQLLAAVVQGKKVDEISASTSNLLFQLRDVHQLFGAILWYYTYAAPRGPQRTLSNATITECISFFDEWPCRLYALLSEKIQTAIMLADRPCSDIPFNSIFGNLLLVSRRLPENFLIANPVLKAIFAFLDECLHADDERSEIGYSLLNGYEAAILLDTDSDQVARLSDEGYLPMSRKLKNDAVFDPKRSLFRVRDTFNVWVARFQCRRSNRHIYLSRW